MNQPSEMRSRFLELTGQIVQWLGGVPRPLPGPLPDPSVVETACIELKSGGISLRLMHCGTEDYTRLLILECALGVAVTKDRAEFLKILLALNLESWPRVLSLDSQSDSVICTWTFQLSETDMHAVLVHCAEAASLSAKWQSDGFLAPVQSAMSFFN